MHRRWKAVWLLAAGIAIGAVLTGSRATAHVGRTVAHLWNQHLKPKADKRYYTKAKVDARLARDLTIGIGTRAEGNLGCPDGTLSVGIRNGNGARVDHRFTFLVSGSSTFGQIRADGVADTATNIDGVTHAPGSGIYCIAFNTPPSTNALRSSVVSLHCRN